MAIDFEHTYEAGCELVPVLEGGGEVKRDTANCKHCGEEIYRATDMWLKKQNWFHQRNDSMPCAPTYAEPDTRTSQPAGSLSDAEHEFLAASMAVWREIDRLSALPEGYHGLDASTELRKRERKAWERYKGNVSTAQPEARERTINEWNGVEKVLSDALAKARLYPEPTESAIRSVVQGIQRRIAAALSSIPAQERARWEFLDASIAVWREIDKGGPPLDSSVELRKRERAAWEQYRAVLDNSAAALSSIPEPSEQKESGS